MANYKNLGVPFDRTFRNDLNNNFKNLGDAFDNAVEEVSNNAFNKVVDKAKINWLSPVATLSDLVTSYPDATEGKTAMVRDTGKVYRFDGSDWKEIQQIDAGPVNAVDARLTSQLADTETYLHGNIKAQKLKKGIISFTWDNSYNEQYDIVFPEFKSRNFPFALSPVSDDFASRQKDAAYYNYTHLKEMVDYGAEIISHGATGLVMNTAGLDLAQVEYEIAEAKRFWTKLGFKINGFCATNSVLDPSYHAILKKYHDYGFTEYWTDLTTAQATINDTNDLYQLGRQSLYTLYTNGGAQAIKDAIDYVELNGGWLNFYNHRVDDTGVGDSIPLTVLQEILNYLQTKNVSVLNPTDAVNRLNSKLIAGENLSNLRSEMDSRVIRPSKNILGNPQFRGTSSDVEWWERTSTITSGVTTSFFDNIHHRTIKYTFDTTDNTGKKIGIKKTFPMRQQGNSDVLCLSIEVESNTNDADLEIVLQVKNGTTIINDAYSLQEISKGKKAYEVSVILPIATFQEIAVEFNVIPRTAAAMTISLSKPKTEYARNRTTWMDYLTYDDTVDTSFKFTNISNNSPTPNVTGLKAISLGNTAATTVTDFVSTSGDQEITIMFATANTTVKGSGYIRLRDGLDFTGSVGDVLTLVKNPILSSAWYEKSRTDRTV